ncbi:MAG: helix-turn-helix domain-containing protein [Anaerolineae bacterium]|nr:helix-turn-helix domain-containing protein [Anaerolineae bacterium]
MSTDLAEALSKELKRRNLSLRRAAQEIDVSHTTLSRLMSGKTRPDVDTCTRIAEFLRLRVSRVLELAGYAEAGDLTGTDSPLYEQYVGAWRELREENREFVVRMIQALLDTSEDSG